MKAGLVITGLLFLVCTLFLAEALIHADEEHEHVPIVKHPPSHSREDHSHNHPHLHDHDHSHDHFHEHSHDHVHTSHDHFHDHLHQHTHAHSTTTAPESSNWMYGLLSTLAISVLPIFFLPLLPIGKLRGDSDPTLQILVSFAVGGLLGDVFIHLIPHSLAPHSHDHSTDHEEHSHEAGLSVGIAVLSGILIFFIIEKSARAVHSQNPSHGHSHGHSKEPKKQKNDPPSSLRKRKQGANSSEKETTQQMEDKTKEKQKAHLKIGAYLNLLADTAHNFTDGLAIAASFVGGGTAMGLTTTFAVLLHEIPHEIGDYAILIQSGFTRWQAMYAQLLTAVGAMIGALVGLAIEGIDGQVASQWILPFTAGGFIYIATVDVLPELLQQRSSLIHSIFEVVAFCVGVGLMVVVVFLEEGNHEH